MAERKTLLVIGGYGVFGERLISQLSDIASLHILVAGRSLKRALRLIERVGPQARAELEAYRFDLIYNLEAQLERAAPWAVVNMAGPFQALNLSLPQACITTGCHYLDIADGREFVTSIDRLDALAKREGMAVVSGASSVPALSHAVIDQLTRDWHDIDSIDIAIAPGNRVPRGPNVVRAILSYVGRPVRVFDDGAWTKRAGWSMMSRPVLPGLGRRWLSLCDVPDLDTAVARYAPKRRAVFRAGLELSVMHLGLWLLSWLPRMGWPRDLTPLTMTLRRVAEWLAPFGSDRGGMHIELRGTDKQGRMAQADWSLIAEEGDGPYVPVLAASALIRKWIVKSPEPGAGPCVGYLTPEDILPKFGPLHLWTRDAVHIEDGPDLYARVLDKKFTALSDPIRRLHETGWSRVFEGRAKVEGGRGPLARLARAIFGLPSPRKDCPVKVVISRQASGEAWVRHFGESTFRSVLTSASAGRLRERFGMVWCDFDLVVDDTGDLAMNLCRWGIGPLPLPKTLAPTIEARETVDGAGRFQFDIDLWHVFAGTIMAYRGWLMPHQDTMD